MLTERAKIKHILQMTIFLGLIINFADYITYKFYGKKEGQQKNKYYKNKGEKENWKKDF